MRADPYGSVEHQCRGKQQHTTRAYAKQHIIRMQAVGKATGRHLSVYLCPHCGYYHVGRRPKVTGW